MQTDSWINSAGSIGVGKEGSQDRVFRVIAFELIREIVNIETIAAGSSIREIARLRKRYGSCGKWRKLKVFGRVRLADGQNMKLSFTGMKHMESANRN